MIHFLSKGVIEILSSDLELGGLKYAVKMRLAIAPASVACILSHMADNIANSVWGYCFICCMGTPRPGIWIKQDTILTPFLYPIANGF